MYVDRIMKTEMLTAAPGETLAALAERMSDGALRHIMVEEEGKLVGVISSRDFQKASPSSITTLSAGEVKYLYTKMTAGQIMHTEVVTCSTTTLIEEAGLLLRKNRIGCLPVVDEGKLAGMVTTEDILDFFLDITGCEMAESTVRIALHLKDETGELGKLLGSINAMGGYIATVVSPVRQDETGMRIAIVRYRAEDGRTLDDKLEAMGYDVITENLPQKG